MQTVYYSVTSNNYYWGVHGLSDLVLWEDVRIFVKKSDKYKQVAFPCVCSKEYFSLSMEDLIEDCSPEDEWILKVEQFLKRDDVVYEYYYDDPGDEDFSEVEFNAERNENGIKPRSLELWYPSSRLGQAEIEDAVCQFCNKFLSMNDLVIEELNGVNFDEAVKDFLGFEDDTNNLKRITVSEEVINELSERTGKSKTDIEKLIKHSIR